MWKPGRKGNDHEVIGLKQLPEIWGVAEPAQIIDLLGLMGDASDNIPGVPGIGPKTAQKLIAEFGTVENLLANTASIKGKQKENLETHADQAMLSKELATIIVDVPVEVSWDDLVLSQRDDDALKVLFNEFEFRTLSKRLFTAAGAETAAQETPSEQPVIFETFKTIRDVEHTYHLADTPELQSRLFEELGKQDAFCFDIETTGLHRFTSRVLGVAFSWKAQEAWYLPWSDAVVPGLRAVLSSPAGQQLPDFDPAHLDNPVRGDLEFALARQDDGLTVRAQNGQAV